MNALRLYVQASLPLDVYARRPAGELPFPFDQSDWTLFSRARHGLWQGIHALGLEPGDDVLVPSYHHGSEIEALRRAQLGLSFYEAGRTLEPDLEELESLLGPRVRALYLTHYLGFPQDLERWRAWCDERELLLLEDAAQAWLSSGVSGPTGSLGDLAIFCVYKSVGVPDGGALVVRARAPRPETASPLGVAPLLKGHARWAVQRSEALAGLASRADTNREYDATSDFDLGDPGSSATAATRYLLPRLANGQVAAGRRANYEFLLDLVRHRVRPPFDAMPAGASPFALPVETDDKERLIARLAMQGIEALDFWSVPHPALPAERFPGARERRARTVCLPVHQELRAADLERIASAFQPPRRRRPDVRLEPVASFDELGGLWDELATRDGNVFAAREWMELWWRHFGRANRLLLTACRSSSGELVAILPLYQTTSMGLRVLRLLGHGAADQMGPVCAPEDLRRAARALRRFLDERTVAWDFFLGELLPGDEPWSNMLGGRTISRDGSPLLRFEQETWSDYLATRSRHFRKQLGRTDRQLRRDHGVHIRLADDRARLPDDLDSLFALHRLQWTDEESPFGANEPFHRAFATEAFDRGWLYLWFFEVDGQPVAAEYTFRFGRAQHHYQGGRDSEWDRASVGTALFMHSLRAALEDGVCECRFLRGREQYKYRFATDDPELETVGVARGSFTAATLATALALRRWYDVGSLRRRLGP